MRTFEAKYDGPCGLCDGRIKEGEDVVYVDDELVHALCAEENGDEVQWSWNDA